MIWLPQSEWLDSYVHQTFGKMARVLRVVADEQGTTVSVLTSKGLLEASIDFGDFMTVSHARNAPYEKLMYHLRCKVTKESS